MRFQYIGLKQDGERAFKEKTGIEWMPGSEHDVTDEHVAAEMLKHPTIWKPVETKPAQLANAASSTQQKVVDPLEGLSDAEVRAYAKERGIKIKSIGVLKGANLRAKVHAQLNPAKS